MAKKNQVFFLEPGEAESFVLKGIQIDQLLPLEACEQFSAYVVRMEPAQIKKPSYHQRGEELYYVLSGAGKAALDGKNYEGELTDKYMEDIKYYLMNISRKNKKEINDFIDQIEEQVKLQKKEIV